MEEGRDSLPGPFQQIVVRGASRSSVHMYIARLYEQLPRRVAVFHRGCWGCHVLKHGKTYGVRMRAGSTVIEYGKTILETEMKNLGNRGEVKIIRLTPSTV